MLEPGSIVRGHTVTALLGEGGMGAVYAATRETDGLEVAIKILRNARPEHVERFRIEAAAQQRLGHPHVVRVLEVFEHQGQPAMVMERVRGPSLRAWMDLGKAPFSNAMTLFRGVLAGVAHAHERGLIHRDLKPSNVLLAVGDEGVVPKVADFGLARLLEGGERATRTGVMLGTPGYMAPEQIRDAKRADRRADVFALGVMLYELVCGKPPLPATDVIAAYEAAVNQAWEPPESLGAPGPISEAIRAALAPDPEQRPPDAAALYRALDPDATYLDAPDLGEVLDPRTEGAARARSLEADALASVVDPTRPALRTPIAPAEGGLFGREDLLAELAREVAGPGAVVLRGPPGVGKTAACRELGRFQGTQRSWTGGVWWVPLRDVDGVEAAVGRVLGVVEGGSVAHALERRGRMLLVLDEAEWRASEAAEAVGRWVEAAPKLTVLLTSRVALDVPEVRTVVAGPLAPSDAVALFIRRARQQRDGWIPNAQERRAVQDLVVRLDGLPLAIELAATRARVLGPAALLERIERRLDVLRTRGEDPRSASLRGAIAESWELLEPAQRDAVLALSAAVGPVAPEAADALLASVDPDPLLLLEELEDASWLTVVDAPDGRRFTLLETLRAYAREQLGDRAEPAFRAHGELWLARAEAALERAESRGDPAARAVLEAEVDDLLAVVDRFSDDALGLRAALASARVLGLRGELARSEDLARLATSATERIGASSLEARVLLAERVAVSRPADSVALARELLDEPLDPRQAIRVRAAFGRGADRTEAGLTALVEAADLARALDDPALEARVVRSLAAAHDVRGDDQTAERLTEAALVRLRRVGHPPLEADLESFLGLLRFRRGDWAGGEAALKKAAELAAGAGERKIHAATLGRLAMCYARAGRQDDAAEALGRALTLFRQLGDVVGEGFCHANLGALAGEPSEAARSFREALELGRRGGSWQLESLATRNLGINEIQRGAPERAVPLLGELGDRLAELGDGSAARVRAWHALALAGTGALDRARAALPVVDPEHGDHDLVAVARWIVERLEAPGEDWKDALDRRTGPLEERGWDYRLTSELGDRLLGRNR